MVSFEVKPNDISTILFMNTKEDLYNLRRPMRVSPSPSPKYQSQYHEYQSQYQYQHEDEYQYQYRRTTRRTEYSTCIVEKYMEPRCILQNLVLCLNDSPSLKVTQVLFLLAAVPNICSNNILTKCKLPQIDSSQAIHLHRY